MPLDDTAHMMLRITLLWIAGIILIVPYSIYQLLSVAEPEDYALLIVLPLFWVFGFWGVVGPILTAWRVHGLVNALAAATTLGEARKAFETLEGKETLVDILAREHKVPRFVARWVLDRAASRFQDTAGP